MPAQRRDEIIASVFGQSVVDAIRMASLPPDASKAERDEFAADCERRLDALAAAAAPSIIDRTIEAKYGMPWDPPMATPPIDTSEPKPEDDTYIVYWCPDCRAVTSAHHDMSPPRGKCPVCRSEQASNIYGLGYRWVRFRAGEKEQAERIVGAPITIGGAAVVWYARLAVPPDDIDPLGR